MLQCRCWSGPWSHVKAQLQKFLVPNLSSCWQDLSPQGMWTEASVPCLPLAESCLRVTAKWASTSSSVASCMIRGSTWGERERERQKDRQNQKDETYGLPWWRSGWESACQCRAHGFEPWSGKIPHAAEQLGPWATTTEPARLEPVLRNKRGRDSERPVHRD